MEQSNNTESRQLRSTLDALWDNVKEYRSSGHYKQMLDFCARFRNLAPYNAMLVQIQRPGAKDIP